MGLVTLETVVFRCRYGLLALFFDKAECPRQRIEPLQLRLSLLRRGSKFESPREHSSVPIQLRLKAWATTYLVVFLVSNRWVALLVAAVFFIIAFLILFQQKVVAGYWFQIADLHHETFAIASVALGVGVLVGATIASINKE